MSEDCKDLGVGWKRRLAARNDYSRQESARRDWALSFSAESQVVVMGTRESASGQADPCLHQEWRVGRPTVIRYFTPRECLEQGKHEGSCVICPQEPGVHT